MRAEPSARASDPGTSREGARHARPKSEEQKQAILWLLRHIGPMTDHELQFQYKRHRAEHNWPMTQLDGVRKRRSDLKTEGRVYDTGTVSGFAGSPPSIVWAAVEVEAEAA